jgi:hypothetical protein
MRSITKVLLILAVLVLAGCATKQPVIDEPTISDTIYVYQDCGTPPRRETLVFVPLSWQVIDGRFSVDAEGYKDLAYNMSEIRKGVEELKVEIRYYLKCLDHGV